MDDRTSIRVTDPDRLAAVWRTGLLDTPAEEAFDRLGRLAATVLQAPYAFVTLVDDRRSFWKSCIGVDASDPADRQNLVEESFCQYVIGTGEPLIVGDVTAHPDTMHNPSIESMGVAAWAGFPLMSPGGQVLGTFCVVDTVVRDWSEADADVLRALSAAASGELALREAVALALVEGAARDQANARLALLAEAGATMSETLDVGDAVGRLARLVVPVLGDWCVASIVQPDGRLRDVAAWHNDPEMLPIAEQFGEVRLDGVEDSGASYAAKRSTEPVLVEHGALEAGLTVLQSDSARALYAELAPASYGVFPLVARNHVNGTLAIVRGSDRPPMSAEEVDLASAVAARAGLALDNARLFAEQKWISQQLQRATDRLRVTADHDRTVSRALQDAMLTHLPTVPGVALAARYRTASGTDQVGGDWYDATATIGSTLSLIVGDVAGHDITAAGTMGQLRNMLRAFAWDRQQGPAATISRLDQAMHALGISTMTTLSMLDVELATSDDAAGGVTGGAVTARWSNAGHPAPAVISPGGDVSFLATAVDLPLAVDPDRERGECALELDPGTTVVLYTDGLVETRESDIDARQERLLQALAVHHTLGLDELLDAVLTEMVGEHPVDDVVILAARLAEPTP